jgi:glutathione S-transferase
MYTLHIGNKNYSSWSLRPWVLMSELGIAFEEKGHVFGQDFQQTIGGKSPTRKVPVLHDGGLVVWDSLAIAEYLAERHPGVWPADAGARAWARCAAAEMHSGFQALRNDCSMSCGVRVKMNPPSNALKKDVARIGELFTEGLERFGGPFLARSGFRRRGRVLLPGGLPRAVVRPRAPPGRGCVREASPRAAVDEALVRRRARRALPRP